MRAEAGSAERLYYDDPAATEFTAQVTAIREVARVDGRQVWQIALDRTTFYPTGGGQPHDTGVLTATARSGASLGAPISEVVEDDAGEVWHTTAKPLQEGTVVHGAIDAARRRDHTQQHSGQHLLSAVLYRDFSAKTISFHMGPELSTIDLDCELLTQEQIARAEDDANDAIRQALPVTVRYVTEAEAEAMLADGLLRKLPPRTGRMRLVQIASLDLNACGGTHVRNTAEIGPLLLRGTERVRGGVRLSFVCGERAIAAARTAFQRLGALALSLSTGAGEIASSVARLQAESRSAAKERGALLAALARMEAAVLAATAGTQHVVRRLDPSGPAHDAGYAKLLASALVGSADAQTALVLAAEADRCAVVLAAQPGVIDCGSLLRTSLAACNGRGGGSRELAQGSLPLADLEVFLASLQRDLPW